MRKRMYQFQVISKTDGRWEVVTKYVEGISPEDAYQTITAELSSYPTRTDIVGVNFIKVVK